MDEVNQLVKAIKSRQFAPVYLLMGEEPYYIDRISQLLENEVLNESERDFNQSVLYGREVSIDQVVSACKRFPMMADHQLVVLKEAQNLNKTIDQLADYVENLQPSTILVVCYKYSSIDKRKKLYKSILQNGVVYQSKKLYENQVPDWIRSVLSSRSYEIEPKAAALLVEHLGTDLSLIDNELQKLQLIVPKSEKITSDHIEKNVGISKDFNNFELIKALGVGDRVRAFRIIRYFAQNPNSNPVVVTLGLLFNFFSQLLQFHGLDNHNPSHVAQVLGINPYFVKDYQLAAKHYPMKSVAPILNSIRNCDMRSKGVGGSNLGPSDLLKQLISEIFQFVK